MKSFKYFRNLDEEDEDYRKHDGKREKKTSWKEQSREKRKDRWEEKEED